MRYFGLIGRLLIIVLCSLAFLGVGLLFPELLTPGTVMAFVAIFGVLFSTLFYFYNKLGGTQVGMLGVREIERYMAKKVEIRARMATMLAVLAVAAVALWLVATTGKPVFGEWFSAVVGMLVGVAISYLVVLLRWIVDLDEFGDLLLAKEQRKKSTEAVTKRLDASSH